MKNYRKKRAKNKPVIYLITVLLIAIALSLMFILISQKQTQDQTNNIPKTNEDSNQNNEEQKNYCPPNQQDEQIACIQLYQPVCGWFNPEKIQCIKYPCAATYSNSCTACADSKVQYWTAGECPE